jgi:hypothetical protein
MTLTTRQREEIACRNGESFKAVASAAFRRGHEQAGKPRPLRPRFVLPSMTCGFRSGGDSRKLNQLVDKLQIKDFDRELTVSTAGR